MKKNIDKPQSGFAHLIIIVVILALALVGTLGFIFWQNFMQPKTSTKSSDNSSKSAVSEPAVKTILYKTVSFDSSKTILASLSVPEDWSVSKTERDNDSTGYGGSETIKLTSPNSDVTVDLSATNATGIGGTCSDEGASYYMFTSYDIKNFSLSANLVETVVKSNGEYSFTSVIDKPFSYSDTAMLSRSTCSSFEANYIPYKSPLSVDGFFQAEIHIASMTKYVSPSNIPVPTTVTSVGPINTALASPNYITARNILLSLKS